MFRQTALPHVVEKPSLCRVPEEASIVSYSLCARQPSFHLLAFNIAYNIIPDFILKSNPLMQKLKKKFQLLEPSLKDEGHLRSTGDALLLKGLFALCAAQMITVMVNRRSEKRINIRLDRLYVLRFFFELRTFIIEPLLLFKKSLLFRLQCLQARQFSSPCMARSVLRAASKITSSASCFALNPGLSFAFWKASYTGLSRW